MKEPDKAVMLGKIISQISEMHTILKIDSRLWLTLVETDYWLKLQFNTKYCKHFSRYDIPETKHYKAAQTLEGSPFKTNTDPTHKSFGSPKNG